ncbi:MAG: ABC transporter substrate-binding protein [Actinomycetota bacterium]|nr:ABC transporter substrate-binding protein [Actinomycetota bacterium]
MTRARPWTRLLAAGVALSFVAAACGDDDDDAASTDDTAAEEESSDTTAADEGSTDDTEAEGDGEDVAAAECPETIVIQTDWFPEPEHGATYQLIGPDGERDSDNGFYSGPLAEPYAEAFGDNVPNIEIRAGGPYLGDQSVSAQMYVDDAITFGFVSNDTAVQFSDQLPTLAVVAPLDINPQFIMWDPEQYDFETFADMGESDISILVFSDQFSFVKYYVGNGDWTADQIDPSYDGSPARWVDSQGEGLAQQGFVSNEKYAYENQVEGWQKPVDYLLLHDGGYEIYSQPLAIRAGDKESLDSCLQAFVPVVQQAIVDYAEAPEAINEMLLTYVEELASFWTLSEGGVAEAVEIMTELGLHGNGPDDTIGDFEEDRVQGVIDLLLPIFEADGLDSFNPDVAVSDIVTNEYIDESIGM